MFRPVVAGIVTGWLLLLAASLPAQTVSAGTDPWYAPTTKVQFQSMKAPGFQIDWPKKDWMVLPSAGSLSLVLASRKGDAIVLVETVGLRQALEPSDITELFAQLESDAIKEKQKVVDLQSRVIDAGGARRLVAVQYQRTGVQGGVERARQYSVPAGKVLYRVTCVATAAQFLAYDPLFAHMAASFVASPR